MDTIALYNLKGGVGKTSAAVNLAALSAQEGAKTLLWDLDPQGSATFYLGMTPVAKKLARRLVEGRRTLSEFAFKSPSENLSIVPHNFSMRQLDKHLYNSSSSRSQIQRMIMPLASNYDRLILDCPPGIGIVAENVFRAADALLIPLIPTPLSMNTWFQIDGFLADEEKKPNVVLPFFSMADRRKRIHNDILESNKKDRQIAKAIIPFTAEVEKMGVELRPTVEYSPKSRASLAFAELWSEVKSRLESSS